MSNALQQLTQSRKFWIAFLTAIADTAMLIAGEFAPQYKPLVQQLLLIWTPLAGVLIATYAYEDAQIKGQLAAEAERINRQCELTKPDGTMAANSHTDRRDTA